MKSTEILKRASALTRIFSGPGAQLTRAISRRPLLGAGLDNLKLPSLGRTFGELPPAVQQSALTRSAPLRPVRDQVARYMRSARRNPDVFNGSPQFYPWSQYRKAALPSGQPMTVRFDGYYNPTTPAFTSMTRGKGVTGNFTHGSSGAAPNFQWKGVAMPTDVPGFAEWQRLSQRYPRSL